MKFSEWVVLREHDTHHLANLLDQLISQIDFYISHELGDAQEVPGYNKDAGREIFGLSSQLDKEAANLMSQGGQLAEAGQLLNTARQAIANAQTRNNVQDRVNTMNQGKKYLEQAVRIIRGFHGEPWKTANV